MKKLSTQWQRWLTSQPESGMGYQIGDVILLNGKLIQDVVFSGGNVVAVRTFLHVPFEPHEIKMILLTHRKW